VESLRDGNEVESLKAGESGAIVLNQTPFYAESGGQVGDTGMMTGEGVRFRVTDTQKKAGDLFVHLGTVEQGTVKPGTALLLEVDHARRSSIRANHSATHLLTSTCCSNAYPSCEAVSGQSCGVCCPARSPSSSRTRPGATPG